MLLPALIVVHFSLFSICFTRLSLSLSLSLYLILSFLSLLSLLTFSVPAHISLSQGKSAIRFGGLLQAVGLLKGNYNCSQVSTLALKGNLTFTSREGVCVCGCKLRIISQVSWWNGEVYVQCLL